MRRILGTALLVVALASSASARVLEDWKVQAGATFQRAGEYTVGLRDRTFADAIAAWGDPSSCRMLRFPNHAVATWRSRGIWLELWTYASLPEGETGCTAPNRIYVSEIRLTDRRWTTSLGLRVGDPSAKLRRLYPHARYRPTRRSEYWLVTRREPCLGRCTRYEQRLRAAAPQLPA